MSDQRVLIWFSAMLIVFATCCYVSGLIPSAYWLDSGELQAAVPTYGIAHSPSFPSYILFSNNVCWLPCGDIAYRVNLATAFAASILGLLTFFLSLQLMGSYTITGRVCSLLTALMVITNPMLWFQSIKAEVYSLNLIWILGILICCNGIIREPDNRNGVFRRICLIALFLGLGGTNHSLLTAHIAPVLALMLCLYWSRIRMREYTVVLVLLITTLSIYLYLPIRSMIDPWIDTGNPENWMNFVNAITRRGSFNRFFGGGGAWGGNLVQYFIMMKDHFSLPFFLFAWLGLFHLTIKLPRQGLLLLLAVTFNISVTLVNRNFNMNPDTGPAYLMLSSIILIIGMGVAIHSSLGWLKRTFPSPVILAVTYGGVSLIPLAWTIEGVSNSGKFIDSSAPEVARAILDTCPENSTIYFGMYYNLPFVVSYLQSVEHFRQDIGVISRAEIVYWSGGLQNIRKRYPDIAGSIFQGEYGEILNYLAPRSARHSVQIPYDHARDILFNASAWMAQDESKKNTALWFSSEDDHLLRCTVDAYGPVLKLGDRLLRDPKLAFDPSIIIMRRVRAREECSFLHSRGARALAAFYDQQCVTLTARGKISIAGNARDWRSFYDPNLAGFCD
ncbi:DUF2723 domain-containing protein [bacterium]|nr:DUF2723 domain-containing protein [candidate division CSSED10-310 bacterium]